MLFVRPNCSTFPHSKLSNSFGRRVFVVSNVGVVLESSSFLSDDYHGKTIYRTYKDLYRRSPKPRLFLQKKRKKMLS